MNDRLERPDADLIRSLEAAHYHPLWDRYKRITPMAPKAKDTPMLWRWQDFERFAARAAKEVPIEDVERRAIIMANPAFGGETVTTGNLIGAFTVLEPGDHAVPHRHTASAIRFAIRADGAVTIVNGRRCEMRASDLVLTPAMCWHGHMNESDHRTIWFDAADIPLIHDLDASFFEPGSREAGDFWKVDEGDERLYAAAGFAPASGKPKTAHSPKYRYAGEDMRAMLAAAPNGPDGGVTIRYTNPLTGGAVMPTVDCYMKRITGETKNRRATYNQICLVVSGEGKSVIGDKTFEWSQHDVFTIPHWTWAQHQAGKGADLFLVTDRSLFEAMDLVRVELS
jgi:gentisate 1,2-dioxygenase